MMHQNPTQLFKAQTRGRAENETHRLHATFNFNEFNPDSRNPFGLLTALNDEMLTARESISRKLPAGTLVMILPLIGATECNCDDIESQIVVPGEAFIYYKYDEGNIKVKNPYDENNINFLYVAFSNAMLTETLFPQGFYITKTNLAEKNAFQKLFDVTQNGFSSQIALFKEQSQNIYQIGNKSNGVFLFVVSGTFEVKGMLLDERDGLALWDTEEIDVKALSENAILLLIEVPLNGFTSN